MALQDIVRVLVPRDDRFYDYLEQQAELAHEGATELARLRAEPPKKVQEVVHAVEKRGDKAAHEIEDALARTFVTPLDREDIHNLSARLDDVLDRAYAAASAFVMFGIQKPSEPAAELLDCLVRATLELKNVLPALRKHDFEAIRMAGRAVKAIEKEGDQIYRTAMTSLFASNAEDQGPYRSLEIDARAIIREKEVLEILEEAVDNCEDVAEFLTNLAVKHG
jgi:uncharacterized protein Yka (UPF0111/DUF47 family)